jgi:aerobic carbon-monoxide dehydrogenase medium subunit
VKPAVFDYVRAGSVAEAGELLTKHEGARLLAGGQSLIPMLNLRLARPELLIDISQLDELKRFEETASAWRIGSAVTHAQLEDAGDRLRSAAMMVEVASDIAYRSVRNRGTVGGSLAHADPAGDWPLALAALGAVIHVRGRNDRVRQIAADNFMQAAFTTDLQQDEIIELIEVPKQRPSARYGYFKFCRKAGEFPEASAAVVVDPDGDGSRIFVGALDGAPKPLAELARAVATQGPGAATEDALTAAVAGAAPDLDAVDVCMHAGAVHHAIRKAFRE